MSIRLILFDMKKANTEFCVGFEVVVRFNTYLSINS